MVYVVVIWNMAGRWIFTRHIGKSFARLIMRNFTFLTLMERHQVGVPNHPTLEHHHVSPWVESRWFVLVPEIIVAGCVHLLICV